MAKPDQDTPAEGVSQSAEAEPRGETSSVAPGQTAEDSPERRENQAKTAAGSRDGHGIIPVIQQLQHRVEDLMTEKERMMLAYIHGKLPRPYYVRWKAEVNAMFAQAVVVNTRLRTIKARLAREAKKAAQKSA